MNRRRFLSSLGGLPFLGWVVPPTLETNAPLKTRGLDFLKPYYDEVLILQNHLAMDVYTVATKEAARVFGKRLHDELKNFPVLFSR